MEKELRENQKNILKLFILQVGKNRERRDICIHIRHFPKSMYAKLMRYFLKNTKTLFGEGL